MRQLGVIRLRERQMKGAGSAELVLQYHVIIDMLWAGSCLMMLSWTCSQMPCIASWTAQLERKDDMHAAKQVQKVVHLGKRRCKIGLVEERFGSADLQ